MAGALWTCLILKFGLCMGRWSGRWGLGCCRPSCRQPMRPFGTSGLSVAAAGLLHGPIEWVMVPVVLQAGLPVRRHIYVERGDSTRRVSLHHISRLL